MTTFLANLATVATSPYAFVAYLALIGAWAVVVIRTNRLKTIAHALTLVPEDDRRVLLEKDYGFHLKEGMSAKDFLRAQRASYLFYAFLAVVAASVLLVVLALLRPASSQPDPLRTAVFKIVDAIDDDFLSIKGKREKSDPEDPSTESFESTVVIPGSFYNYIDFERDEPPYFIASLYYGPDERVAADTYHKFVAVLRQLFPDWLEHNQILDKEKLLIDYTTFVKGNRKIIVDINRDHDDPGIIHAMVTFKKPDRKDDDSPREKARVPANLKRDRP